MKNSKLRLPWLLAVPVLLAGCSGLLTSAQPAKQYYLLHPIEAPARPTDVDVQPSLVIRVGVVPGLDTDRILALAPDARIEFYANARWPDYLPEVLGSVLKRSLESTQRFADVGVARHAATDDWFLDIELREFYGLQNAAGTTDSVRVGLAGTVTCHGDAQGVTLSDTRPVSEQRLANVVAAHQAALDAVTRQLIDFLEQRCGYQGKA